MTGWRTKRWISRSCLCYDTITPYVGKELTALKPYLYMMKIKLLLALSYRFQFYINFVVKIVLLFTSAFFWKAAYNGLDDVGLVDERQMMVYSVMSIVLSCVFVINIDGNLRSRVRMGNLAVDFIKPVDVFLMYFAEDVGSMLTSLFQNALPVLLFAALFIVFPTPYSPLHFILFITSACLSFLILWLISALFGLLYFWFIDMGPLSNIKDYLILILSGSFVPIWFFPIGVRRVLSLLPFIYTYQLPLSIYIGRSSAADALEGMLIQLLWVVLFTLAFVRLKNRVVKNISVQGG